MSEAQEVETTPKKKSEPSSMILYISLNIISLSLGNRALS